MQLLSNNLPFILVFVAVVCMVMAVGSLFASGGTIRRRLEIAASADEGRGRIRTPTGSFYRAVVRPLQRYLLPLDLEQRSTLRLRLLQAGYFAPTAPAAYYGARIVLGVALPLMVAIFAPILVARIPLSIVIVLLVASGIVGYVLPMVFVSRRVSARQRAARESFPDALDMMLMCVEAGLGLDAAIVRVGEEIRLAHPMLAGHFDHLSAEIRVGKMRDEAFRAFADRIGVEEVRSFVALLVQSEELGTNMADTLRSMADDMRQRRLLHAEELANMVSAKLSMVLSLIIVPVLLTVIISPAALNAYHNFSHVRFNHFSLGR